jgi:SAM-dependent methyltransferase
MISCFDESPEIYERARPLYPEQMWDELFSLLPATPSVLEIGPGTGKATGALLVRGARVVACEPGRNLARYLRNKFDTATLEVRNEGFEASSPDLADYDAVVAATSFHWVDPLVRVRMAHAALRPGGILAVIDTNQVESEADRGYFAASQPIYDRYFPGDPSPAPILAGRNVIPQAFGEIREAGLFESVELRRYDWDQRYSTAAYIDLVRSYSGTAQMEAGRREAFLAELADFIERDYEGYVVRPLVITMVLATTREQGA